MTYDFLIIGGGIAGISAAARLSHLGSVLVLEMESALGYHTSGRSAAMFEEAYGLPPVLALNRASKDYHMTANGGVTSPRGMMVIGRADQRAAFDEDVLGFGAEEIPLAEARDKFPILNPKTVAFAAYDPAPMDLDTDLLLQNFAREARGNGGIITTSAAVTAIRRTATGWEIDTAGNTYTAHTLINAAGSWVDKIATLAGIAPLGFTPYRRSMARIPAPGGHDVRHWPMIFGPGEDWYAKPDAGKLLVSPAEEHLMEPHDAFADDMVLAEGLARYEEMVTEPVTRLETSWAGLRTFAPDRALVIGPSPQDPGFFWIAGQGGYGFQTSPAASQLAADILAGRPPEIGGDMAAALSPARFAT